MRENVGRGQIEQESASETLFSNRISRIRSKPGRFPVVSRLFPVQFLGFYRVAPVVEGYFFGSTEKGNPGAG